jgi:hypothetical protein
MTSTLTSSILLPNIHRSTTPTPTTSSTSAEATIIKFDPSALCDFQLYLSDERTGMRHTFHVHKVMLAIRCTYFQRLLVEASSGIDSMDLNSTIAHQYGCTVLEDFLRSVYSTELKQYMLDMVYERKNIAAMFHLALTFEYSDLLECAHIAVYSISSYEYLYETFKQAVRMSIGVLIEKCIHYIVGRKCLEQIIIIGGGVDEFIRDFSIGILLRILRCQVEGRCGVDGKKQNIGKQQLSEDEIKETS